VSHQRRPGQNWPWGPKLPQVQNLNGRFVFFFLGSQNRNFEKVREVKLLLSLKKIMYYITKWQHVITRYMYTLKKWIPLIYIIQIKSCLNSLFFLNARGWPTLKIRLFF